MIILTLNCGSSSVKYQLFDWKEKRVVSKGIVERVTIDGSFIRHSTGTGEEIKIDHECPNHKEAIELIIKTIVDSKIGALREIGEVRAVGHRVVHGGNRFTKSILIDGEALETFKSIQHLAPLHLPANITGIEAALQVLPDVPHCAIMDTAWHQSMPETAYMYALPYEWYEEHHVRRYGFHGTSFLYCAKRAAVLLEKEPLSVNLIICHIGNGASACAVRNGVSVDTSMGLTPLEGLVMGTRSGDCDPAIAFHMIRQIGATPEEVESQMNRKSGILGISGEYADRRDALAAAEKGHRRAALALEIESYRLKKYIGSYSAVLGRVDAIVFTAGVGEMHSLIREGALSGLEPLGISIDSEKNKLSKTRNAETEISEGKSRVRIFVIPTDEELVMTEDTYALTNGSYDDHINFEYSFQKKNYINEERLAALQRDLENNPSLESILVR